eukprot:COSAG05_NODE_4956_length_1312_cov_1.389942_2_plen_113_part_00
MLVRQMSHVPAGCMTGKTLRGARLGLMLFRPRGWIKRLLATQCQRTAVTAAPSRLLSPRLSRPLSSGTTAEGSGSAERRIHEVLTARFEVSCDCLCFFESPLVLDSTHARLI